MSLTLLAGILAPIYLKLVLDPKGAHKAMKEISKSQGLMLVFSFFYFFLSALILSSTGLHFPFEWYALLNWLGLAIFVKGVFFLMPGVMEKWMKKFDAKSFPVLGFIGLLFTLALVYVDLKVLA